MTGLTNIHLIDNDLSGTVPTELGCLTLSSLRLDENVLTGSIPTELGKLGSSLESDAVLSTNGFCDDIPSQG